jgi:hypothetical protein
VSVDEWAGFFAASAGAAAGLTGLIIVAMSVNIGTIIAIPSITSRAGATIAALVLAVVSSSAALIPGQPLWLLGAEVLAVGLAAACFAVESSYRVLADRGSGSLLAAAGKCLVLLVQVAPFLVGAALLVAGDTAGLGWIAGGVLAVFVGSVLNAWVLLVEILR